MEHTAEAEDVALFAVLLAQEDFRGDVASGADDEVASVVLGGELSTASEVGDVELVFFLAGFVDKDVVDFDVAVDDVSFVEGLEAGRHLAHDLLSLRLEEGLVDRSLDIVEEGATVHVASDRVEVCFVLERFDQVEDVGAASNFLHELVFNEVLALGSEDVSDDFLGGSLDGDFHVGVLVPGKDHVAEGAAAEGTKDLVLSHAVIHEALGGHNFGVPVVEGVFAVENDSALDVFRSQEREAVNALLFTRDSLVDGAHEGVQGIGQLLGLGTVFSDEFDSSVSDFNAEGFQVVVLGPHEALLGEGLLRVGIPGLQISAMFTLNSQGTFDVLLS